jgi:hypothetical protein
MTFIPALLLVAGIHYTLGWQYSLVVPLAYGYLRPPSAWAWGALQMALVSAAFFVASYVSAPAETTAALGVSAAILTFNMTKTSGWWLPVVSVLFFGALGALAGVLGVMIRLTVQLNAKDKRLARKA